MKKTFSLLVSLWMMLPLIGQEFHALDEIADWEKTKWQRQFSASLRQDVASANNPADIFYARFHWEVDPGMNYIKGVITMHFSLPEMVNNMEFDFSDSLQMDSVLWSGESIVFEQENGVLTVHFPQPPSWIDSLTFFYQGMPSVTGFGSFAVEKHNDVPVMWTLSEPYGARDWMPCKQSLDDKIDSIDIFITHPIQYKAVSNGVLQSEWMNNNVMTTHWKHRYPIATYLIAFAVTNYEVFSIDIPHPDGNTHVMNYVYPESLNSAQISMANLIDQMSLFSNLFGNYPFHEEKYGHAQFNWGGGMEHQTISFMGSFGYELMAHELAHQWFGDKVTCGSWQDIWLNEGFATYLSGLCYEYLQPQYWYPFKQQRISHVTSQPGGSVFVPDTTSVNRIFNSRLSYAKGAMVLHMLRWICGDNAFYQAVRNYLEDTDIAYHYARTSDLQYHLEMISGIDLSEFFADWYFGEGFPSYTITWQQDVSNVLTFQVNQTQSHASVDYFELPLPVKVIGEQGQEQEFVLDHFFDGQIFIRNGDFIVDSVVFDPDLWLITKDNMIQKNITDVRNWRLADFDFYIEPQTLNEGSIRISLKAPLAGTMAFTLSDVSGRRIGEGTFVFDAGITKNIMLGTHLQAGSYVITLNNNQVSLSAMTVLF